MQTEQHKQRPFDLYAFLVLMLAVIVTWPCILLEVPFEGDNPVHYSKILALSKDLLNGQGLFSWSHLWFGGYPTNFNYPMAPYFIVIGFRYLSLGLLSFDAAYALSILVTFFTFGLGVYLLASQSLPRYMALVAACFALMDGGGPSLGGYVWLVKYGCWPGGFAIGLCFISLASYLEAFRTRLARDYQKATIFLGAALFCHPISMVFLCLMIPAFAIYFLMGRFRSDKSIHPNIRYLVVSLGFAILGGLFEMAPVLYGAPFADAMGFSWISFSDFWKQFLGFELFPNLNPIIAHCWVLGSILSLFLNRGLNRLFAMIGLGILVFATQDVSTKIFTQISPLISKNVEFTRFVWLAKVFLFIASTAALNSIFVFLNRLRDKKINLAVIAVLVVIGLTASSVWKWPSFERQFYFSSSTKTPYSENSKYAALESWFCSLHLPETDFFRVASDVGDYNMDHNVYYVASKCNVPILKLGFTPAISFRYRYGGIDLNQLQRLAVKYVISDKEMTHPNLKLANQFRNIFIYDVVGFQGPATVIQGQATVVLKEWNQNYIQYEISNSKEAVIEIPLTDIGFWVATQKSRPIQTLNLAAKDSPGGGFGKGGGELFLVRIPVEDGPLQLKYSPPLAPRMLSYLGLAVWLLMVVTYWVW